MAYSLSSTQIVVEVIHQKSLLLSGGVWDPDLHGWRKEDTKTTSFKRGLGEP